MASAPSVPPIDDRERGARQAHGLVRRFLIVFAFAWIVCTAITSAWALTTPLAAAPDEPAHIVKAASVARGQLVGPSTPKGNVVQVPSYIAWTNNQTCTAFTETVTADCVTQVPGDPTTLVDITTTAGLYNPLYYVLVGWPSLVFDDSTGIFAMRLMSALVCSFFLAVGFALIATWRHRALPVIAFLTAATPVTLFLAGTINPNGLEVTAMMAAVVGLLTITTRQSAAPLWLPLSALVVGGVFAANTRGLSPLWLAMAIAAALVLLPGRDLLALLKRRSVQVTIVLVALGTAAAAAWLLGSNSLAMAVDPNAPPPPYPHVGDAPIVGVAVILDLTFYYGAQMIGEFGWLDTPAPDAVFFIWPAVIGLLLLGAGVLLRGRRLVVAVLLMAAVVFVPALLQGVWVTSGGIIWQGRYTLPLFALMLLTIGALLAEHGSALGRSIQRRLVVILIAALGFAQFLSYIGALRRYSIGDTGGSWLAMITRPEWTPPGGMTLWLAVGVLTIGAACFGAARLALRARAEDELVTVR
ncbi:Predicted membrane protein [Plantibacter flavus]|uniref:Putative membrane protein DUF2142 n=1 Tax=Plantibacter flavus TaxID=150123 RepID=A0A3N2C4I9_9MICO|nr:DUF2142 domain-containing protein [Plantibacter flavus]ROR82437.1 putative membrane protein DUF2142 [Plantibacter flavus]SMG44194.1 Predicted membrane protein [Plantibacter flavus]